jgi:peptide/nickel transport system permease protein
MIWKKFRRNFLGLSGLVLITFFALVAVFAPLLAPVPKNNFGRTLTIPNQMLQEGFSPIPVAPSLAHPFGLTQSGYDIYFGVIWGTRQAFIVGLIVIAISLLVGLIIGTLAGYFGGWLDSLLMRFTDIIFAFPSLVLLIVIVVVTGRSLFSIMLALALVSWGQYARIVRSEILKVKPLEFVAASQALGSPTTRIIGLHVLPNSLTSLMVLVSLDIGTIVVTAAALSFLGLGAPSGFPDWGQLISLSRNWLSQPQYWFTYTYPGLAIILFVLGWSLIGDALREAIDPRSET